MKLALPPFDLAATLASGQVFRWRPIGNLYQVHVPGTDFYAGWIGDSFVQVAQKNGHLEFKGTTPEEIERFFALDLDLPDIHSQIDVDEHIHAAIAAAPGLRVIRQEPWECTASFILSAYNNIPRLTGMLNRLAENYGQASASTPRRGDTLAAPFATTQRVVAPFRSGLALAGVRHGPTLPARPSRNASQVSPAPRVGSALPAHSFPRAEAIAEASEKQLRACGLGYRAPLLKAAAQKVASGQVDLEKISVLEDEPLREALLEIPGVGQKVVECVMLFAYARAGAFPVDVWIGRVMRERYFKRRRKVSDAKLRVFARQHFGPYCGWAQQLMYHSARSS